MSANIGTDPAWLYTATCTKEEELIVQLILGHYTSDTHRARSPNMMNGGRAARSRDDANRIAAIPLKSNSMPREPRATTVRLAKDCSIENASPLAEPRMAARQGAANKCVNAPSNRFRTTNARESA